MIKTMTNTITQDFYQLTPDTVLDAIESVGLEPQAALLALNSYENRVYQFRDHDNQRFVVKFYRPNRWTNAQIKEEHDFCWQLFEQEIPVVAPLRIAGESLFEHQGFRFALFPSQGGRAPNLDDPQVRQWLGRFMARIHLLGETEAYQVRPALSVESFGQESRQFLLEHSFIPGHLKESYSQLTRSVLTLCQQSFEQAGDLSLLRLHGDSHPGNVLWTDAGPHFVDFDDSRMGVAIQDLWMLVGDSHDRSQWHDLLDGYEDFREFNDREMQLVEPLRSLRMIHYSAWLARRWDDPSFQMNFPWFASPDYWQEQIAALSEQLTKLQRPDPGFNHGF